MSANRATTFDYSNATTLGREASTYISTNVATAPQLDGTISVGEYTTTPRTYAASSKSVTEYAAQDDTYVYLAFEIPAGAYSFDLFLRAQSDIFTNANWAPYMQLKIHCAADGGVAVGDAHPGINKFTADEWSAIINNKPSNSATPGVVEVKFTKEGLKRAFGVTDLKGLGYRFREAGGNAGTWTYYDAGTAITSYGGFSSAAELGTAYSVTIQSSNAIHYVVLGEAPTTPAVYCAPSGCTVDGHDRRADTFDVADMRCLDLLPGHFVPETKAKKDIERSVLNNLPVDIDGVVSVGEYTSSKVYNNANDFTNYADTTVTVTEYIAHDADYVYMALVYNTDMKNADIRMNGTPAVRTGVLATESRYEFKYTFGTNDEAKLVQNKKNFATEFSAGTVEGFGKKANGTTTVELKLSKAEMKRVFETDTLDCFGYYGEASTAAGKAITNAGRFRNDALTACGWGTSSAAMAAAYGLDMSKYNSAWRIMNVVVLTDETLPATAPVYCPAEDTCTAAGHANRAAAFDVADMRCLNLLPGHFVPQTEIKGYGANGVIDEAEYRSITKFVNADAAGNPFERAAGSPDFAAGALPVAGGYVKEYVAQDDNNIYLGFEMNQDMAEATIFFNGKEKAATDIYEHSNVQAFKYTFAEGSDCSIAVGDAVN